MIRARSEFILPSGRSVYVVGLEEGSKSEFRCVYTDCQGGEVVLTAMFLIGYGTPI